MFPRELSAREYAWLEWLLPSDKPGYKKVLDTLHPLMVIGEGRWGANDLVLGAIGSEIDRTEGMQPVLAFGEITAAECNVVLSLHAPNDLGQMEFQLSTSTGESLPVRLSEQRRWTYSTWSPGSPCPATGSAVREIPLPADPAELRLVIAPQRRAIWLHDGRDLTNRIMPVSGYYNELVILCGIRDPKIALNHALLFDESVRWTDQQLIDAFIRYNVLYRKVALDLFDTPRTQRAPLWSRILRRGNR